VDKQRKYMMFWKTRAFSKGDKRVVKGGRHKKVMRNYLLKDNPASILCYLSVTMPQ